MSDWTPESVRAAAAEWAWVPPAAQQVLTSEYQLIAYPAHYYHPTQVAWSGPTRPGSLCSTWSGSPGSRRTASG